MKYRRYQLRLTGNDQQAIALLIARLPKIFESLGETRETARAIKILFPQVDAEIISMQRPQPVTAKRVRVL